MLVLPDELREEVRRPFGKVVKGAALAKEYAKAVRPLITVGDRCLSDALDAKHAPDIAIFDFKVKRVEIPLEMKRKFATFVAQAYVVMSGPGCVTEDLEAAVVKVLQEEKGAVIVVGEDDLSALLIMAHAEKGTLIYGQPDVGAVVVNLGEPALVEKVKKLLLQMGRV